MAENLLCYSAKFGRVGGGGPVNKHLWLKVIQRAKLKLIGKLFGWNYKHGKRHGILYIMIPRN